MQNKFCHHYKDNDFFVASGMIADFFDIESDWRLRCGDGVAIFVVWVIW
jgi:hypothetical protein